MSISPPIHNQKSRPRPCWSALLLAIYLFFSVLPDAAAQDLSSLSEDEQVTLLNLMSSGNQAFDDGDFASACDYYSEVTTILEFADIYYRLAACHERLHHYDDAAQAYQQYLHLAGDIPDRRRILAEIERLQQLDRASQSGSASLSTQPPGASVHLDDKLLGTTPLDLDLPVGSYEITFEHPDFLPSTRSLQIQSGERTDLSITLESPARLRVLTDPDGSQVYLGDRNGQLLGETPLDTTLDPGHYDLLLVRSGYPDQHRTIQVQRDQTVELSVSMARNQRNWLQISGLSSLGLGLLAGATGGYFHWQAESLTRQANSYSRSHPDNTRAELRQIETDAVNMQSYTQVAYISAGVLLATSATLLILSRNHSTDNDDAQLVLSPTPHGGAYAGLHLRF